MITKHFFKTLILFIVMIALGLAGVFWVNSFEKETNSGAIATPVAK